MANSDLLEKATAAGARLAEAERHELLCRAEYHTAIRRLHLAGASLREIARALSLSHQRVQQIVAVAGGSWWRRAWRTRTLARDAVCTWCDRPPSEVAGLIAGPNVYICDACVRAAEQTLAGTAEGHQTVKRAKYGATHLCAFCCKRGTATRALLLGPANVCSDCVRLCREILDSHRRAGV